MSKKLVKLISTKNTDAIVYATYDQNNIIKFITAEIAQFLYFDTATATAIVIC